ncbi:VOC family protein [Thalassotalea euphylliae]|uniref:VOC family protein n=1 Tax=Thalassotalea euphylliae TaxID=1655234 RepID=A0A3E0U3V1_9GAMM|nr:VOC family protein [Thalassotalea euphylliae]REL30662.1 VOC family protein [Thalassotalea euphylliae]
MTSKQQVSAINLLVGDYQAALDFYTEKLGFVVSDDVQMEDHRWLTVSPSEQSTLKLILHKAQTDAQQSAIGMQAGDAVLAILQTDNFEQKYAEMQQAGVEFCEQPRHEPYDTVVIFKDLYGNRWDLIELSA